MTARSLRVPQFAGDSIIDNGIEYLSWDGVSWDPVSTDRSPAGQDAEMDTPDDRTLVEGLNADYSIDADITVAIAAGADWVTDDGSDTSLYTPYTFPRSDRVWRFSFPTVTNRNRFMNELPAGTSGFVIAPAGLTDPDDIESMAIFQPAIILSYNTNTGDRRNRTLDVTFEIPLTLTENPNLTDAAIALYTVREHREVLRVLQPGAGIEFTDVDENGTVTVTAHAASSAGATTLGGLTDVNIPADFAGVFTDPVLESVFQDHNHHDRSYFWTDTGSITFNFINLTADDIAAFTALDPTNGIHHLRLTYPMVDGMTDVEIQVTSVALGIVGMGSVHNAIQLEGTIIAGFEILEDAANSSVPDDDFPDYHEINDTQIDNVTNIQVTTEVGHNDGDLLGWDQADRRWEPVNPTSLPTKMNILLGTQGPRLDDDIIHEGDTFTDASELVLGANISDAADAAILLIIDSSLGYTVGAQIRMTQGNIVLTATVTAIGASNLTIGDIDIQGEMPEDAFVSFNPGVNVQVRGNIYTDVRRDQFTADGRVWFFWPGLRQDVNGAIQNTNVDGALGLFSDNEDPHADTATTFNLIG